MAERELADYLWSTFAVRIPNTAVCPGHQAPWKAFCDAYFARHAVTVWKAARGFGGKTFALALLSLVEALLLRANVAVLGGSGEQAARVLKHQATLWQATGAPRGVLASDPARRVTRFRSGNEIESLLASQRSVRGPHPQRLRLDEVDEMDLDIFEAAMGQTMEGDTNIPTQTVISSTHQYGDGTMSEVLDRAQQRGWPVYSWCHHETSAAPWGWLKKHEIERKRNEVGSDMWRVEYEMGEPKLANLAFLPEALESAFEAGADEWAWDGDEGEECIVEEPVKDAIYAVGADWAKAIDWTVFHVLRTDCDPWRTVFWLRMGRRPWPTMVSRFDLVLKRYPGAAAHDAQGVGGVVDDYLEGEAEAVVGGGNKRANLFNRCIGHVDHGRVSLANIEFMRVQLRRTRNRDLYSTAGHPPDPFIALAMACHAADEGRAAGDHGYTP